MRRYVIAQRVGKRIRTLRKKRRLTQEEVAARAGLHVTTLGRIERAQINAPLQTLNKIAQAIGIHPKELL